MKQCLGDARFINRKERGYNTFGWRLGVRVGKVYKLKTARGFLVVEVLEMHRKLVVIREVEDTPRFSVNPLYLSEYKKSTTAS